MSHPAARRAIRALTTAGAALIVLPLALGARGCDEPSGPGTCFCPEIYAPVCGVDGTTYGNACEADCAGIGVAHSGECEEAYCPEIYAPVCGSDGVTYDSECVAWRSGVMVVAMGPCECPAVLCDLACEGAFARDERGCPTCACEPPPVEYCFADSECGEGARCDTTECRSPCEGDESPDRACPAVCYGVCVSEPPPPPPPTYCFSDDECGPHGACDHSECRSPCEGGDPGMACPAVCYGVCQYAPPPPPPPPSCGGFAGLACPLPWQVCIDDPSDDCDPARGGADCAGVCVGEVPPAPACGGIAGLSGPEPWQVCVDDPRDDCDPEHGGADCMGLCEPGGWCGTE